MTTYVLRSLCACACSSAQNVNHTFAGAATRLGDCASGLCAARQLARGPHASAAVIFAWLMSTVLRAVLQNSGRDPCAGRQLGGRAWTHACVCGRERILARNPRARSESRPNKSFEAFDGLNLVPAQVQLLQAPARAVYSLVIADGHLVAKERSHG